MLLPNEFIENSIETYIYRYTTSSQRIYWIVLAAVAITLVSLPFIYVDISVQGEGVIRPVAEKTEIKSPVNEIVDSVYVKEGDQVQKGDIILRFRTSSQDYKIAYQSNRLSDFSEQLSDLSYLAKGACPPSFQSPVRRQEYNYYIKRKKELETSLDQAEKEFLRNKALFEKNVLPEEEYDKYYYRYESQKNELASLKENQMSTWQADLNTLRNSHDEMYVSLNQDIKDKDMCYIKSPVSGTLDQFSGIYRGSSVRVGESLAVISPDSTLYFEIYVTPRNIGYISIGMTVNVQIESFNYNEWGTVSGEVNDISSDFITDGQGNSYYKVKCSMDKTYLQRKNGRIGRLKKGMTVSAHFMITRRSLFDLLYQRLDDWVNPTQYNTQAANNK